MSDVDITTEGGKTRLAAPYTHELPARARALGGRFDRATKEWRFDARDEQRVRTLAREIYGTDGSETAVVDVRVHLDRHHNVRTDQRSLWMFGRELAHRPERDKTVRLGRGVILAEGGFGSRGGSVANPRLSTDEGTILEVRDVPAGHEDLEHESVEIIETGGVDHDALQAEKKQLETRLAEINILLGK